jgi:hypothetical protein
MLPEIEFDKDFFDAAEDQKNKGWLICNHFEGLNLLLNTCAAKINTFLGSGWLTH